jgi:hypothetical protein
MGKCPMNQKVIAGYSKIIFAGLSAAAIPEVLASTVCLAWFDPFASS